MLHHTHLADVSNLVQSLSGGLGKMTFALLRTLLPDSPDHGVQEVSEGNVNVLKFCCQF